MYVYISGNVTLWDANDSDLLQLALWIVQCSKITMMKIILLQQPNQLSSNGIRLRIIIVAIIYFVILFNFFFFREFAIVSIFVIFLCKKIIYGNLRWNWNLSTPANQSLWRKCTGINGMIGCWSNGTNEDVKQLKTNLEPERNKRYIF